MSYGRSPYEWSKTTASFGPAALVLIIEAPPSGIVPEGKLEWIGANDPRWLWQRGRS